MRMIQIRSIWKGVPSKKIACGKKSAMDGAWNPPSPSGAARSRGVAGVLRRTPGGQRSARRHVREGTPSDLAVMDSRVAYRMIGRAPAPASGVIPRLSTGPAHGWT
jgi:hypothetical protein